MAPDGAEVPVVADAAAPNPLLVTPLPKTGAAAAMGVALALPKMLPIGADAAEAGAATAGVAVAPGFASELPTFPNT